MRGRRRGPVRRVLQHPVLLDVVRHHASCRRRLLPDACADDACADEVPHRIALAVRARPIDRARALQVRDCEIWAASGDCDANAAYMRSSCARSCRLCGDDEGTVAVAGGAPAGVGCADSAVSAGKCAGWADGGQCERNRRFMSQHCARTCALCDGGEGAAACADEDIKCAGWAAEGEVGL